MALIAIDGINNEVLVDEATDARDILTDLAGNSPDFDGDGRVFELKDVTISNESVTTDAVVELWDANEGAGPAAANQRATIIVPANSTVERKWETRGPTFTIGCVASLDGGNGTINIGAIHASGYLH